MERLNPITDEPLTRRQIDALDRIEAGRLRAKADARSGHPARRASGRAFLRAVPRLRARVYAR